MGKKYNTHYRVHVYDMSNPAIPRQRAFLPALKMKGQAGAIEFAPKGRVFGSFHEAHQFARDHWWNELGLPDPDHPESWHQYMEPEA